MNGQPDRSIAVRPLQHCSYTIGFSAHHEKRRTSPSCGFKATGRLSKRSHPQSTASAAHWRIVASLLHAYPQDSRHRWQCAPKEVPELGPTLGLEKLARIDSERRASGFLFYPVISDTPIVPEQRFSGRWLTLVVEVSGLAGSHCGW